MRFLLCLYFCVLIQVNHAGVNPVNFPLSSDTAHPGTAIKKTTPEAKWTIFWNTFTAAIDARDTAVVAQLTSPNFYDGGGSTIQQWLQSDVYASEKTLTAFKSVLRKGVKNYKGFDPGPYKATGKNTSGDYFFEYKKGQWLFGGVVGD